MLSYNISTLQNKLDSIWVDRWMIMNDNDAAEPKKIRNNNKKNKGT
jgi:hypothetical protein